MKTLLVLSVVSEVFLLALAFSPTHLDSRSAARALVEWRTNPTTETEAAWRREKAKNEHTNLSVGVFICVLIALNTWGMVALIRRVRRMSQFAAG